MKNGVLKWFREHYNQITNSIAFLPALIAIGFLVASWLLLLLDFSETGKNIKAGLSWLSLKDASTARTIVGTIAGGILSLTVFSFSMVMILLNQAASQMSNRLLDNLIGNTFQQTILGFYIGTIVYSLFLLSTIRDINSGIYVPALSIYLLLVLTIVDIFLFIYFLHYITQSVKYQTIIKRIHSQTKKSLDKYGTSEKESFTVPADREYQVVPVQESGYFQSFDEKQLKKMAADKKGIIEFLYPPGTYLIKSTPLLRFYTTETITEDDIKDLMLAIDFFDGQPIEQNPYYGYHQLAEVAIKALSPGINDPETAILSLHALTDLLAYRLNQHPQKLYWDEAGKVRLITVVRTFEQLFEECVYAIWHYGKNDRYIQNAMLHMLTQLKQFDHQQLESSVFNKLMIAVNKQISDQPG